MIGAADSSVIEKEVKGLSVSGYFRLLARLLGEPQQFFAGMPEDQEDVRIAAEYLTLSSLICVAATLMTGAYRNPLFMGGVLFVNAVGMTVMAAGLGYIIMVMAFGKRASFKRLFSIYAFAAGTTILTSWTPLFVIVAEPWKWWLIYTGLTRRARLSLREALLIIVFSIGGLFLFFWSALPLVTG